MACERSMSGEQRLGRAASGQKERATAGLPVGDQLCPFRGQSGALDVKRGRECPELLACPVIRVTNSNGGQRSGRTRAGVRPRTPTLWPWGTVGDVRASRGRAERVAAGSGAPQSRRAAIVCITCSVAAARARLGRPPVIASDDRPVLGVAFHVKHRRSRRRRPTSGGDDELIPEPFEQLRPDGADRQLVDRVMERAVLEQQPPALPRAGRVRRRSPALGEVTQLGRGRPHPHGRASPRARRASPPGLRGPAGRHATRRPGRRPLSTHVRRRWPDRAPRWRAAPHASWAARPPAASPAGISASRSPGARSPASTRDRSSATVRSTMPDIVRHRR